MFEGIDTTRFRGARIGVAYGGRKAEREISLVTGKALSDALRSKGYAVEEYDLPGDLKRLVDAPPAALLLGLHGDGEDGTFQGLLEILRVPYTGSGVLASALCMDKSKAKAVMAAQGVSLARGEALSRALLADPERFASFLSERDWLAGGYVLKPTDSGSSHGVHVLDRDAPFDAAIADLAQILSDGLATGAMIEERLSGPEYSVGFFGEVCLGAIQITPAHGFYDFHAKYKASDTTYEPLDGELAERIMAVASHAWRALGGRGVGRVDVMGDGSRGEQGPERLCVLEANTIPGMTATSLVPKLAARRGVPFPDFVELMVSAARTDASEEVRQGEGSPEPAPRTTTA